MYVFIIQPLTARDQLTYVCMYPCKFKTWVSVGPTVSKADPSVEKLAKYSEKTIKYGEKASQFEQDRSQNSTDSSDNSSIFINIC